MSKNLFLIGLATVTLAATTLTNVASSRADTISTAGSGNSSSSGKLTVAQPSIAVGEPAPTKTSPRDEGRVCAAVVPAPPGCSSSPAPSNPPPATDRFHNLPYPYSVPVPPYPSYPPMSEIPVPIH
jgi:hypothetical protein